MQGRIAAVTSKGKAFSGVAFVDVKSVAETTPYRFCRDVLNVVTRLRVRRLSIIDYDCCNCAMVGLLSFCVASRACVSVLRANSIVIAIAVVIPTAVGMGLP